MERPALSSDELQGLLSRVALGDRGAFERLYHAVASSLLGVVLRLVRDRSQAEEILQEVFVNIWRKAASYDLTRQAPMAWLVSVARYRAIDGLREKRPDWVEPPMLDARGETLAGDWLDRFAADAPGPDLQWSAAQEAQHLQHCLKQLTAQQRQCIALAYFDGLSQAEVAQHLVQPLGSVKSWVRRGLLALRRCMEA